MGAELDPTSVRDSSAGDFTAGVIAPFTILLVDDDADCRAFVRDAIGELGSGYRVVERENGKEAIDFLFACDAVNRPNIIFLDVEMPRMGGLETLEAIKGEPRLKEIPVVMLTGVEDDQIIQRAALLGANSYTLKPGKVEAFIQTVLASTNYWLTVHQYARRRPAVSEDFGARRAAS